MPLRIGYVGELGAVQPQPGKHVADVLRNLGAAAWARMRRPLSEKEYKVTHRDNNTTRLAKSDRGGHAASRREEQRSRWAANRPCTHLLHEPRATRGLRCDSIRSHEAEQDAYRTARPPSRQPSSCARASCSGPVLGADFDGREPMNTFPRCRRQNPTESVCDPREQLRRRARSQHNNVLPNSATRTPYFGRRHPLPDQATVGPLHRPSAESPQSRRPNAPKC